MGPISGLAKITPKIDLESFLSDSFRDTAGFSIEFVQKKWVAKATHKSFFYYLSTPASAATDDALDLSTKPGPDGMFAPGNKPAPLLYKCITMIGM